MSSKKQAKPATERHANGKRNGGEWKTAAPLFIGRWTPRILFSLNERPHRHADLRRQLGSVSQRMLTRTLRNLEFNGLIARRVTRLKPIAVEYSLSKFGKTIIAPLGGMCRWAKLHGKDVTADVHLSHERRLDNRKT